MTAGVPGGGWVTVSLKSPVPSRPRPPSPIPFPRALCSLHARTVEGEFWSLVNLFPGMRSGFHVVGFSAESMWARVRLTRVDFAANLCPPCMRPRRPARLQTPSQRQLESIVVKPAIPNHGLSTSVAANPATAAFEAVYRCLRARRRVWPRVQWWWPRWPVP